MNTLWLPSFLIVACMALTLPLQAQYSYINSEEPSAVTTTTEKESKTLSPYRFHKKLSNLYNGFAIEVIASNYPLDRTNPIFRKFGNVHYDKLERGGYSYLILGNFSSEESALHFLKNIIIPKAPEARLIFYKDGIRKVVRED